jgi:hypothetical protein
MQNNLFPDLHEKLVDPPAIPPCDPNAAPGAAVRLSRQSEAILDRLRKGRASNRELAALALKYTSRMSDIRAAGHDVRVVEQDHGSGLAVYALFVGGEELRCT